MAGDIGWRGPHRTTQGCDRDAKLALLAILAAAALVAARQLIARAT